MSGEATQLDNALGAAEAAALGVAYTTAPATAAAPLPVPHYYATIYPGPSEAIPDEFANAEGGATVKKGGTPSTANSLCETTSTRGAVESAIELSKGDRLVTWEESVKKLLNSIAQWDDSGQPVERPSGSARPCP